CYTKPAIFLEAWLQTEYAAPRSVRPAAYRELTVGRSDRHRLIERHQLAVDHPARRRRGCARVTLAVVVTTAPFAGGVLERASIDPAVMGKRGRASEKYEQKNGQ